MCLERLVRRTSIHEVRTSERFHDMVRFLGSRSFQGPPSFAPALGDFVVFIWFIGITTSLTMRCWLVVNWLASRGFLPPGLDRCGCFGDEPQQCQPLRVHPFGQSPLAPCRLVPTSAVCRITAHPHRRSSVCFSFVVRGRQVLCINPRAGTHCSCFQKMLYA